MVGSCVKPFQGLFRISPILTQGVLEDSRPWAVLWNRFAVFAYAEGVSHLSPGSRVFERTLGTKTVQSIQTPKGFHNLRHPSICKTPSGYLNLARFLFQRDRYPGTVTVSTSLTSPIGSSPVMDWA